MIHKVFVFADDHELLRLRASPNLEVSSIMKSDIDHMQSLVSLTGYPSRQCWWKLRVD